MIVLGAIALVAASAWLSLLLAHIGAHNALAAAGVPAFGLGMAAVIMQRRHLKLHLDGKEIGLLAFLLAASFVMLFPGFEYAIADKDPGLYVAHAYSIERQGSYAYHDPTLSPDLPVSDETPQARFPGLWVDDTSTGRIVPQFFHLLPAAMATALGLFGAGALFSFNGLAGTLAVLGLALVVRRVFGMAAAIIGGTLLVTNMLEVWHARYPTTEMLTQMLVVGALLALVISAQNGWRAPAAIGGGLVGLTFLARPDGLLLVLLSAAVLAVLFALRRFDARCAWFALGLTVVMPHALLQAYHFADAYAVDNRTPSLPRFMAFLAFCVLAALGLRIAFSGPEVSRRINVYLLGGRQQSVGFAITILAGLGIALAFLRPQLFGESYADFRGTTIRTFDEDTMRRLAWFFTVPGIGAMWFGFASVAIRRWQASAWLALAPGAFLPLYLLRARVSSRLMWSTRRFVPFVVVTVVVLIAAGIAWAISQRHSRSLRMAAAAIFAYLLAAQSTMSFPLRGHNEFGGSYALGREIAALAGPGPGVFLWSHPAGWSWHPGRILGGPLALIHGQYSALLPLEPRLSDLEAYGRKFTDLPIFVIAPGSSFPESIQTESIEAIRHVTLSLPMWEESDTARPRHAQTLPLDFTIWRFHAAS